jgi:hypothetical protein
METNSTEFLESIFMDPFLEMDENQRKDFNADLTESQRANLFSSLVAEGHSFLPINNTTPSGYMTGFLRTTNLNSKKDFVAQLSSKQRRSDLMLSLKLQVSSTESLISGKSIFFFLTVKPTSSQSQSQKQRPGNHKKDSEKEQTRKKRTPTRRVHSSDGQPKIGNSFTYSISKHYITYILKVKWNLQRK